MYIFGMNKDFDILYYFLIILNIFNNFDKNYVYMI